MTKFKLSMLVSVFSLLSYTAEGMQQFNDPSRAGVPNGQTAAVPKKRISALPEARKPRFVRTRKDWANLNELGEEIEELVIDKFGENVNIASTASRAVEAFTSCKKKGWTNDEDEIIKNWVSCHGAKDWSRLAYKHFRKSNHESIELTRTGKQFRERWYNHLDPNPNSKPWTDEEDRYLRELHDQLGNQWGKISALMAGRSDNAIKSRWYSSVEKRLDEFGNFSSEKKLKSEKIRVKPQTKEQPAFGSNIMDAANAVTTSVRSLLSEISVDHKLAPFEGWVNSSLSWFESSIREASINQQEIVPSQSTTNDFEGQYENQPWSNPNANLNNFGGQLWNQPRSNPQSNANNFNLSYLEPILPDPQSNTNNSSFRFYESDDLEPKYPPLSMSYPAPSADNQ